MARLFKRWFMSPETEIFLYGMAGITITAMEQSILNADEYLKEVKNAPLPAGHFGPLAEQHVKTILSFAVLARSYTVYAYLFSYFAVLAVAFFGRCRFLLLPWLLLSMLRHFLVDVAMAVTGAFICLTYQFTPVCGEFLVIKLIRLGAATYMWSSVRLLYKELSAFAAEGVAGLAGDAARISVVAGTSRSKAWKGGRAGDQPLSAYALSQDATRLLNRALLRLHMRSPDEDDDDDTPADRPSCGSLSVTGKPLRRHISGGITSAASTACAKLPSGTTKGGDDESKVAATRSLDALLTMLDYNAEALAPLVARRREERRAGEGASPRQRAIFFLRITERDVMAARRRTFRALGGSCSSFTGPRTISKRTGELLPQAGSVNTKVNSSTEVGGAPNAQYEASKVRSDFDTRTSVTDTIRPAFHVHLQPPDVTLDSVTKATVSREEFHNVKVTTSRGTSPWRETNLKNETQVVVSSIASSTKCTGGSIVTTTTDEEKGSHPCLTAKSTFDEHENEMSHGIHKSDSEKMEAQEKDSKTSGIKKVNFKVDGVLISSKENKIDSDKVSVCDTEISNEIQEARCLIPDSKDDTSKSKNSKDVKNDICVVVETDVSVTNVSEAKSVNKKQENQTRVKLDASQNEGGRKKRERSRELMKRYGNVVRERSLKKSENLNKGISNEKSHIETTNEKKPVSEFSPSNTTRSSNFPREHKTREIRGTADPAGDTKMHENSNRTKTPDTQLLSRALPLSVVSPISVIGRPTNNTSIRRKPVREKFEPRSEIKSVPRTGESKVPNFKGEKLNRGLIDPDTKTVELLKHSWGKELESIKQESKFTVTKCPASRTPTCRGKDSKVSKGIESKNVESKTPSSQKGLTEQRAVDPKHLDRRSTKGAVDHCGPPTKSGTYPAYGSGTESPSPLRNTNARSSVTAKGAAAGKTAAVIKEAPKTKQRVSTQRGLHSRDGNQTNANLNEEPSDSTDKTECLEEIDSPKHPVCTPDSVPKEETSHTIEKYTKHISHSTTCITDLVAYPADNTQQKCGQNAVKFIKVIQKPTNRGTAKFEDTDNYDKENELERTEMSDLGSKEKSSSVCGEGSKMQPRESITEGYDINTTSTNKDDVPLVEMFEKTISKGMNDTGEYECEGKSLLITEAETRECSRPNVIFVTPDFSSSSVTKARVRSAPLTRMESGTCSADFIPELVFKKFAERVKKVVSTESSLIKIDLLTEASPCKIETVDNAIAETASNFRKVMDTITGGWSLEKLPNQPSSSPQKTTLPARKISKEKDTDSKKDLSIILETNNENAFYLNSNISEVESVKEDAYTKGVEASNERMTHSSCILNDNTKGKHESDNLNYNSNKKSFANEEAISIVQSILTEATFTIDSRCSDMLSNSGESKAEVENRIALENASESKMNSQPEIQDNREEGENISPNSCSKHSEISNDVGEACSPKLEYTSKIIPKTSYCEEQDDSSVIVRSHTLKHINVAEQKYPEVNYKKNSVNNNEPLENTNLAALTEIAGDDKETRSCHQTISNHSDSLLLKNIVSTIHNVCSDKLRVLFKEKSQFESISQPDIGSISCVDHTIDKYSAHDVSGTSTTESLQKKAASSIHTTLREIVTSLDIMDSSKSGISELEGNPANENEAKNYEEASPYEAPFLERNFSSDNSRKQETIVVVQSILQEVVASVNEVCFPNSNSKINVPNVNWTNSSNLKDSENNQASKSESSRLCKTHLDSSENLHKPSFEEVFYIVRSILKEIVSVLDIVSSKSVSAIGLSSEVKPPVKDPSLVSHGDIIVDSNILENEAIQKLPDPEAAIIVQSILSDIIPAIVNVCSFNNVSSSSTPSGGTVQYSETVSRVFVGDDKRSTTTKPSMIYPSEEHESLSVVRSILREVVSAVGNETCNKCSSGTKITLEKESLNDMFPPVGEDDIPPKNGTKVQVSFVDENVENKFQDEKVTYNEHSLQTETVRIITACFENSDDTPQSIDNTKDSHLPISFNLDQDHDLKRSSHETLKLDKAVNQDPVTIIQLTLRSLVPKIVDVYSSRTGISSVISESVSDHQTPSSLLMPEADGNDKNIHKVPTNSFQNDQISDEEAPPVVHSILRDVLAAVDNVCVDRREIPDMILSSNKSRSHIETQFACVEDDPNKDSSPKDTSDSGENATIPYEDSTMVCSILNEVVHEILSVCSTKFGSPIVDLPINTGSGSTFTSHLRKYLKSEDDKLPDKHLSSHASSQCTVQSVLKEIANAIKNVRFSTQSSLVTSLECMGTELNLSAGENYINGSDRISNRQKSVERLQRKETVTIINSVLTEVENAIVTVCTKSDILAQIVALDDSSLSPKCAMPNLKTNKDSNIYPTLYSTLDNVNAVDYSAKANISTNNASSLVSDNLDPGRNKCTSEESRSQCVSYFTPPEKLGVSQEEDLNSFVQSILSDVLGKLGDVKTPSKTKSGSNSVVVNVPQTQSKETIDSKVMDDSFLHLSKKLAKSSESQEPNVPFPLVLNSSNLTSHFRISSPDMFSLSSAKDHSSHCHTKTTNIEIPNKRPDSPETVVEVLVEEIAEESSITSEIIPNEKEKQSISNTITDDRIQVLQKPSGNITSADFNETTENGEESCARDDVAMRPSTPHAYQSWPATSQLAPEACELPDGPMIPPPEFSSPTHRFQGLQNADLAPGFATRLAFHPAQDASLPAFPRDPAAAAAANWHHPATLDVDQLQLQVGRLEDGVASFPTEAYLEVARHPVESLGERPPSGRVADTWPMSPAGLYWDSQEALPSQGYFPGPVVSSEATWNDPGLYSTLQNTKIVASRSDVSRPASARSSVFSDLSARSMSSSSESIVRRDSEAAQSEQSNTDLDSPDATTAADRHSRRRAAKERRPS